MGQNSIRSSFFAQRAKKASAVGRSPLQELEVGPRSGPYLLVVIYLSQFGPVLFGSLGVGVTLVPVSPLFTPAEVARVREQV